MNVPSANSLRTSTSVRYGLGPVRHDRLILAARARRRRRVVALAAIRARLSDAPVRNW
jgi:hypothetical protein